MSARPRRPDPVTLGSVDGGRSWAQIPRTSPGPPRTDAPSVSGPPPCHAPRLGSSCFALDDERRERRAEVRGLGSGAGCCLWRMPGTLRSSMHELTKLDLTRLLVLCLGRQTCTECADVSAVFQDSGPWRHRCLSRAVGIPWGPSFAQVGRDRGETSVSIIPSRNGSTDQGLSLPISGACKSQ